MCVLSKHTVQRSPSLSPLNRPGALFSKAASVEEVGPSTKSRIKKRLWLWSPDWKSGPWNSRRKLKWTLELLFCRTDCTVWWTCRNMTLWSHWGLESTMLYTIILFFYKPWLYYFNHALNDQRSGQFTPKNLIRYKLCITELRTSCVFTMFLKKREKRSIVYTVHLTFCCCLFYFQRCPAWLQWPQYNHLANIICP